MITSFNQNISEQIYLWSPKWHFALCSMNIIQSEGVELPLALRMKDQIDYQIATSQFVAFCLGFSLITDCFKKSWLTLKFIFFLIERGVENLISPSNITILLCISFGNHKWSTSKFWRCNLVLQLSVDLSKILNRGKQDCEIYPHTCQWVSPRENFYLFLCNRRTFALFLDILSEV